MRRNAPRQWFVVAPSLVALSFAALPAAAHDHQPPAADEAHAAAAAPAASTADGFQRDVAADLERTGEKLVALAEAIPADEYGWRPAEGVRSVSEALIHVANANLLLPVTLGAAPAEGFTPPADMPAVMAWMQQREAGVTAKDAVVAELRKSVDYAAGALGGLDSAGLEETIQPLGFPASRRAYALILLTHNHEHLGQAIAYARSIGVVPPWSEAPAAEAEAGESSY